MPLRLKAIPSITHEKIKASACSSGCLIHGSMRFTDQASICQTSQRGYLNCLYSAAFFILLSKNHLF